jgi:hypothetical protein
MPVAQLQYRRCVIRLFLLGILTTALTLHGAEQGQLDGSPTLFTVLAAMNATGYDTDLESPTGSPLRKALRAELAKREIPCLPDLKRFFDDHRKKDPSAELSQYISWALAVSGPPDFNSRFRIVDVPPDVVPLEALAPLLTRFYKEAGIDELWKRSQPAYEQAIAKYHEPVTRALLEVNVYLRNATSGYLGRRFSVFVDLLGAPNQIHTRSYADDYFVVLTPAGEPQTNDIRHAYLHYLLDPPSVKYSDLIMKKKGLADYAIPAPALDDSYKADFLLLTTESLIKAVESRLARGREREEIVDRALREGFILAPFFAEQLPAYEKQDQSMKLYFPEMIKAIDLRKEDKRLE